jgi:hypothetical protein
MNAPKILKLVNCCRECPNRHGSECSLVNERIANIDVVAPFCPLSDYPSQIIAGLALTVAGAREPHKWGLDYAVINHVAAKLGLPFNAGRTSITIPYNRNGEVGEARLMSDYTINVDGYSITFVDGDKKFKLSPDSSPPTLSIELKDRPGLWESLLIST